MKISNILDLCKYTLVGGHSSVFFAGTQYLASSGIHFLCRNSVNYKFYQKYKQIDQFISKFAKNWSVLSRIKLKNIKKTFRLDILNVFYNDSTRLQRRAGSAY